MSSHLNGSDLQGNSFVQESSNDCDSKVAHSLRPTRGVLTREWTDHVEVFESELVYVGLHIRFLEVFQ